MSNKRIVNQEEKLEHLIRMMQTNNAPAIEKAKLDFLWEASDLFEVITNYIFLDKIGVNFDFGCSIVKKGTKLFRIRRFEENTDFSNPKEWLPPPSRPQNRANKSGQEALYLGSTETVCCLETHLKLNEKYVLGTYECIEDIEVGGYVSFNNKNVQFTLAAILLNAFLIAPSRGDKNKELFSFLDSYFGKITLDDLSTMSKLTNAKECMYLPFVFGVLNQRDKLYDLTNQLCDIIAKAYPSGIRFSSCYISAETPGIVCSDYNVVLYSPAIHKMKFLSHEIKSFTMQGKNDLVLSDVNIAKIYLGAYEDDQT